MKVTVTIIHTILIELLHFSEINCQKQSLDPSMKYIEPKYVSNILHKIYNIRGNRLFDNRRSGRVWNLYEALSDTVNEAQYNKWLRNEAVDVPEETTAQNERENLEQLVENELVNALSKKSSAVADKPYVQKKGKNDFLVIKSDLKDPFVTIVPNDIYYNSEKKCVNWMDDCNQKGLRERLLQKVNSPYK